MRKTFLKVALIGALAVAMPSTFTSCKDYDDDIENLDNQTAELRKQLESVNTAIAALPTKADVSAAQAAAVAQAKADLEAAKATLEAAIAGKADQSAVNEINAQLSNIMGQLETIEALKGDVTAAMTAIDSSLKDLKEDAQTKGQMIAGLEAQIAELKEAGETNGSNVAALTEELNTLKDLVNDPASGIEALKKQIADLAEQIQGEGGEAASLEATLRVVNKMITSLRLVSDYGDNVLKLKNPIEVTSTPVDPDGNALTIFGLKKGDKKEFTDSVMVQVSPAGATLSKDQLTLINSQLGTIDEYATISDVKAYKGLLTSRAVSNNGLYVVYFKLNENYDYEADKKAADEATKATGKKVYTKFEQATNANEGAGKAIRFALAVTEENEGGLRDIATPYDLYVDGGEVANSWSLDYNVNDRNVTTIHNRFLYAEDGSSYMYVEKNVNDPANNMTGVYGASGSIASYAAAVLQGYVPTGDYEWKDAKQNLAVYAGKYADGEDTKGDNRTKLACYPVEEDKAFTVKINTPEGQEIYGYYVDLDLLRATESDKSERAAWLKYAGKDNVNIEGLGTLTTDGEIEMTIKSEANVPAGDVIGFRVWAVNYDGTLVDPDGRAFYVQVGEKANTSAGVLNANVPVSVDLNSAKNGYVTVLPAQTASVDKLLDWTTSFANVTVTFAMKNDEKKPADKNSVVTLTFPNNEVLKSTMDGKIPAGTTTSVTVNAKNYATFFKNIKVSISDARFYDNQNYTGTLTVSGINNAGKTQVVQEITVNVKKVMPTTLPASFAVTAGLEKDGVINIFANSSTGSGQDLKVNASLQNVFRMFGNSVSTNTTVWYHMAFMLQLTEKAQDTWGSKGEEALYTNWLYQVQDMQYTGWPNQTAKGSQAYKMTDVNTLPGKVRRNLNGDIATEVKGKNIPTLNIVNGEAQNLGIFFKYDKISYDGDTNLKDYVVNTSKKLRVQTYPNTYAVNVPAMPTLTFGETIYINKNAITLSSDWLTKVTNTPLPTVMGWISSTNATEQLLSIKQFNATTPVVNLTGDVAEYFSVSEAAPASGSIKVDPTTGAVTATVNGVEAPIYGVPVVKNANGEYVRDTTAPWVTEVIVLSPNTTITNAPAVPVSGQITLKYADKFGLGDGFGYVNGVYGIKPYSISAAVTMEP